MSEERQWKPGDWVRDTTPRETRVGRVLAITDAGRVRVLWVGSHGNGRYLDAIPFASCVQCKTLAPWVPTPEALAVVGGDAQ